MRRVLIVGGGISGLSTAYYLAKSGVPFTLLERRPALGGVIRTDVVEGCVLEAGPDSFLAAKPWAMDLIRDLGLAGDVIGSNDHQRVTYIWKGGRLVPMPDGLMMMIPTKIMPVVFSPLLGIGTKIRMGLEWFRRPPAAPLPDRSVSDFIADHYGPETVEYLAEPLLAGVFGGDPRVLSAPSVLTRFVELETKHGSLTRGVLAERAGNAANYTPGPLFRTLKGGLGQLVGAIEYAIGPRLDVRFAEAEALERSGDGFRVRAGGEWIQGSEVVLACQAYCAAALVERLDPELARLLGEVDYSSSMTVALGYRKAELGHPLNGFGFLCPKRERRRMVACTWVGTKFSHRAPEDMAVLRCFLGGREALGESDEAVLAAVREELRTIMGVAAEPVFHRISRWPRSMAQYTVGHRDRVRRIEERLPAQPGLHLAGNAYYGIGIPDCVRMGKQAAERIVASIGNPLRVIAR